MSSNGLDHPPLTQMPSFCLLTQRVRSGCWLLAAVFLFDAQWFNQVVSTHFFCIALGHPTAPTLL